MLDYIFCSLRGALESLKALLQTVVVSLRLSFRIPNSALELRLRGHLLGLFFGLFNRTDVHERVFREVIPFSVA